MGIAKYLKAGAININTIERQIEIAEKTLILPYDKLKPEDWGYIYEKYVGQKLESEGFYVEYNGLEKGFLDRGIDLIAAKDNQLFFIQCKYSKGTISKSKIEWILYKASGILYDKFNEQNRKLVFMLVVNKKAINFSRRKPKNFQLNFTDVSKVEFPMLQYFLDHNYVQDKIRLACREIEMIR